MRFRLFLVCVVTASAILVVASAKPGDRLMHGLIVDDGGFIEEDLQIHVSSVEKPIPGEELRIINYLSTVLGVPLRDARPSTAIDLSTENFVQDRELDLNVARPTFLLYVPGLDISLEDVGADGVSIPFSLPTSWISSFEVLSNALSGGEGASSSAYRCVANKHYCSLTTIADEFCTEFKRHNSIGLCPILSVSSNRHLAWLGSEGSHAYWSVSESDIACELNILLTEACRKSEINGGIAKFNVNDVYEVKFGGELEHIAVRNLIDGKEDIYELDEANSIFFGEQYLLHSALDIIDGSLEGDGPYFAVLALEGLKEVFGSGKDVSRYNSIMLESIREVYKRHANHAKNVQTMTSRLSRVGKKTLYELMKEYEQKMYDADRNLFSALFPLLAVEEYDPSFRYTLQTNWSWENVTESDITAFHITTFTSIFLLLIFLGAVLLVVTMKIEKDPLIYMAVGNKKKKA